MLRIALFNCILLLGIYANAETITVKNIEELKQANAAALPGDIIVLKNGEWHNVEIKLNCNGTKENPIVVKAEKPGKVIINGHSRLNIGGSYIMVDGLSFINGFAGNEAVIKFCIDNKQIANHCRVTNTVINDFNNPKRLDENYWVALYGKNNRVDHCSFLSKKNMGVLLAVILEDERSRENYHSIDHNYFGVRLPLASNGGEIIRVGVSQHCEFNSNTIISENFFEHCDGEGEIISIKSGSNLIRNNLFKECQGSVVLRHGDNNTVANNVFLGNNKEGTGGTRIINKGQWVVNNFFYQCRGEGFRTPLAIMNGVPNSPANRYVAVSDAVIANNTYVDCTPMGLCEGSDTERSVPPVNVQFLNNIIYSTKRSQLAYLHDNISGITFAGNLVSDPLNINIPEGFTKSTFKTLQSNMLPAPQKVMLSLHTLSDSVQKASVARLSAPLSLQPGFLDNQLLASIQKNATSNCGAKWFTSKNNQSTKNQLKKDCKNAAEIMAFATANNNTRLMVNLTGNDYIFEAPVYIKNSIVFTTNQKTAIAFTFKQTQSDFLFHLVAGNSLQFSKINLDLKNVQTGSFIISDTSGSSNHVNFKMNDCSISNLSGTFFTAAKSSVADSIIIRNTNFTDGKGMLFNFLAEKDKRGYYNVEKLIMSNNTFTNHTGPLLAMLRGGNDESTLGPNLLFTNNNLTDCNRGSEEAIIHLYGTQYSHMENNTFTNCNPGKNLLLFEDAVRANHQLRNNLFSGSGKVITNKYVVEVGNVVR